MTLTDPQGAEGRETRTITRWRNVYRGDNGDDVVSQLEFHTQGSADDNAHPVLHRIGYQVETYTLTTTTRHPLGGTERE